MFHRAPGSIGASSFPSRVVKGMRAAGRMGGDRVDGAQPEGRCGSTPRTTCWWSGRHSRRAGRLRGRPQGDRAPSRAAGRAGREAVEGRRGQEGRRSQQARSSHWKLIMQLTSSTTTTRRSATLELQRRGLRRPREDRADLGVGGAGERRRAARHARDQDPRAKSAAAARSRGARRAPAARGSARSATRCGARAAPCSGRSRAATSSSCRRRCERGALRAALAAEAGGRAR